MLVKLSRVLKLAINMESASQWVSKMGDRFFADEFSIHGRNIHLQATPQQEIAFSRAVLNDLELRIIEFMLEWMVALLMPAKHMLEIRSPHLAFMLEKECWFRELYLGLKVAASRSQRVKSENH